MNILVIDVGTSSIRGILFDQTGEQLFSHQIEYQVRFFDKIYAEQDASDWSDTIVEIARKTAKYCEAHALTIDALSLTSQRSSIIPVDSDGKALRPAIMWQDKRNSSIVEEFASEVPFVQNRTGARINTVFSGTKMTWFRRNEPELYARTYKILTIADFIVHEITGEYRTDHTYGARSLLMNIRTRQWDDKLLDLFEVERYKLCDLVEPGSVIGHVTEHFAKKTGLPAGIPMVSGGGDQQCGALGQGIYENGSASITTGTGAFILACSDYIPRNLTNNVICGIHAIPGKYVLECSMLACAALYNWAKRELFMDGEEDADSYDRINTAVKGSPAGARGCIALPYFQGRGTPDWNSDAKGAFIDLNLGTTREDLSRAILESIALETKNNLDIVVDYCESFDKIFIGGGLTKFPEFDQIMADAFQRKLIKDLTSSEQTAYGAWLGAAVTLNLYDSYEAAIEPQKRRKKFVTYTPNTSLKGVYQDKQLRMNEAYDNLYAG